MRKALGLATCAFFFGAGAVFGQGTFLFTTRVPGVVDFKVLDCSGPLEGPGCTAQLYGGPIGTPSNQLLPLVPQTTFRTGAGAGWVIPAGAVTVPGVPGGQTVAIQMRVGDDQGGTITSFEAALNAGSTVATSDVFAIGPMADPNA
jgi:hypothetical protein